MKLQKLQWGNAAATMSRTEKAMLLRMAYEDGKLSREVYDRYIEKLAKQGFGEGQRRQ